MAWRRLGAVIGGGGRAGLDRSALLHRKALLQPGQVAGSPSAAGQGKFKDSGPARIKCEAEEMPVLSVLNLVECVAADCSARDTAKLSAQAKGVLST